MKIASKPYIGQHCESTATGTLLNQIGIELSEPMLFGLGEGLSFIFWNMKMMDFPFIGGRIKSDLLTANIELYAKTWRFFTLFTLLLRCN
jgi:hypothetical protein